MKILITILFLSLLSSPSWSETFDDLVKRDGLYYKKFSDVPFSGKLTGKGKNLIKNGKEEGEWTHYYHTGFLLAKGNYENGKREGAWVAYYPNGQLNYKGNFKNHKKEDMWVVYHRYGILDGEATGTYKKGDRIST